MNKTFKYLSKAILVFLPGFMLFSAHASQGDGSSNLFFYSIDDTIPGNNGDSLKYPIPENGYPFSNSGGRSALHLDNPSNIEQSIEFDPKTGQYVFTEKIGDIQYRPSTMMSIEEFRKYDMNQSMRRYWVERNRAETPGRSNLIGPRQININSEAFSTVFGTSTIDITPQGSAELIFAFNLARTDNPTLPERLRRVPSFVFEEKIQMNVTGSIGDKMSLGINYNTEATFDFENKTKLEYKGDEDEIIKKIEAGNITFPLPGSLITGSQSLFGFKTELQFGRLTMTNVFSQQKGESSVVEMKNGAQAQEYEIEVDQYDANRHFFLTHYFKDHYDEWLSENYPIVASPIEITQIEVWITNNNRDYENSRNIVAFADLGESASPDNRSNVYNEDLVAPGYPVPPDNQTNNLYQLLTTTYNGIRSITNATNLLDGEFMQGIEYEKIENARKLTEREFTLNPRLGFISLNSSLNADEVLMVAFEYRDLTSGNTYKVGELTPDALPDPNTIIAKLIKGTAFTPKMPTWSLMMKNIYSIGTYQVERENFSVEVLFKDDRSGSALNYFNDPALPADHPLKDSTLLMAFGLDQLNAQGKNSPDGIFDFKEGVTIYAEKGRIIFPVLEPFGEHLRQVITRGNPNDPILKPIAEKYIFDELYDSTRTVAKQLAEKNKFFIAGTYQSSKGSEIMLNAMNVPKGSVKVTAGSRELVENVDYTVDYILGRVKIINPSLMESNTPIKVSLESQSLFSIQTKTMVGTHLDYKFNEDFNLGATFLNLTEKPLTQKVNYGDEPISNTIWGLNTSWRTESQAVTTLIDKLPFLETKEKSSFTFDGEFAHLIPGQNKIIGKNGVVYIDDFEGSETSIDMKNFSAWELASTPVKEYAPELFQQNPLSYGFGRSRVAWYMIDPIFTESRINTPQHLKNDPDALSSHYIRQVKQTEIWDIDVQFGEEFNFPVLNFAFYPRERGPYNYDTLVNFDGTLRNPGDRWGGIMREIPQSDFDAANIEYIEIWLMDPYVEQLDTRVDDDPKLVINLGNVSEDILKDSKKMFENGLPTEEDYDSTDVRFTAWGRVPNKQSLVNSFDIDRDNPEIRALQDVGLDGFNDEGEATFFDSVYLNHMETMLLNGFISQEAYDKIVEDPSTDNFHYFRGDDYDDQKLGVLERYKNYNGMENNSPDGSFNQDNYTPSNSNLPDVEDINNDNTLSESENYYHYEIPLSSDMLDPNRNPFITDVVETDEIEFVNGEKSRVNWYQFKIPIVNYEEVVGNISGFESIRFMRMYLTGFNDSIILRFARLDFVRSEWRKYRYGLVEGAERTVSPQPSAASFDVGAVNIEENSERLPVNYVLPPGIERENDALTNVPLELNEQSMVVKISDLANGDARAVYKNTDIDMRLYKRLRMFVHAEEMIENPGLEDGDLTAFIRVGSDYQNNYYEYEVPLELTPHLTGEDFYNDNIPEDRKLVWPDNNQFVIELEDLINAKLSRNEAERNDPDNVSRIMRYPYNQPSRNATIYVKGNPNLSDIRTIMIGIRNPARGRDDDGLPKSAEIWFNELRLTDFNNEGGWAANAYVTSKLADFASVNLSGNISTPGFGSIDQKTNERSKEEIKQYDVTANVQMGKFFPEETGVNLPVYFGLSETFITPQYDPTNPDVEFKEALQELDSKHEREALKQASQDYTKISSFNLANVSIAPGEGKAKPWDISNFSTTFAYNKMEKHNISVEHNLEKTMKLGFMYNWNTRPVNVAPLKKTQLFRSKYMRLVKDFNFNVSPSRISFKTDYNRYYNENKLRNVYSVISGSDADFLSPLFVDKELNRNRSFNVKWDLSRTLKFDFSTNLKSRLIEHPEDRHDQQYLDWYDSVVNDVFWALKFSEFNDHIQNDMYNHKFNVSYHVPINKIPLLDWTSLSTRYSGTYSWTYIPPITRNGLDEIHFGNEIRNSGSWQNNLQLNMVNLYNKVGYLKKINNKFKGRGRNKSKKKEYKDVTYKREDVYFREGARKTITHKLRTEEVTISVIDIDGKEVKGAMTIVDENKIRFEANRDAPDATIVVTGKREKRENPLIFIFESGVRTMMSVRNFNVSYKLTGGTTLPGYNLGRATDFGLTAPGLPFMAGYQDRDFALKAIENDWLVRQSNQLNPFLMTKQEVLDVRSSIEPIPNLKIDVNANRNYSESFSEYYVFDQERGVFPSRQELSKMQTGNFSMSFLSVMTAFGKIDAKTSEPFEKLKNDYREIIARRLAQQRLNDDNTGKYQPFTGGSVIWDYEEWGPRLDSAGNVLTTNGIAGYDGYSTTSQQVLIPAFLAAYGGYNPDKITTKLFPWMMYPNWRVRYNGLSKIEFVKEYLRSVTLNHTYRSSYSLSSYVLNTDYNSFDYNGTTYARDLQNNFAAQYEVTQVSINEQFSPLFGIDLNFKNSLTTRFEIKRSRTVLLSMTNSQVIENLSRDFVIGAGYRIEGVQINTNNRELESDINIRADVGIRQSISYIRKLEEGNEQPQSGSLDFTFRLTADYQLSDNFTIMGYIDRKANTPYVSVTFPTANTEIGFTLRFELM